MRARITRTELWVAIFNAVDWIALVFAVGVILWTSAVPKNPIVFQAVLVAFTFGSLYGAATAVWAWRDAYRDRAALVSHRSVDSVTLAIADANMRREALRSVALAGFAYIGITTMLGIVDVLTTRAVLLTVVMLVVMNERMDARQRVKTLQILMTAIQQERLKS